MLECVTCYKNYHHEFDLHFLLVAHVIILYFIKVCVDVSVCYKYRVGVKWNSQVLQGLERRGCLADIFGVCQIVIDY